MAATTLANPKLANLVKKGAGTGLGTKLLILMSLALIVIIWFGYLYLSEMEDLLVDSQANAQLLTAEGIATLLNGRSDLFYELPLSPEGYEQLYVHPLQNPLRIDGQENDWEEVLEYRTGFGKSEQEPSGDQFSLLIGEHNDQLYALLTVKDDMLVFRDQNILRLDLSDHLRITFTDQNETIRKVVVTMTAPGITSAYVIDDDWRYAFQGKPENRIPGFMLATAEGYTVEFRIPLSMLGVNRQFGLAVVDVDDAETREIKSLTGTLPSTGQEALGLVLLKSPEVLRIIEGLEYSGANIQVIDAQKRIRAEVGNHESNLQPPSMQGESWTDTWLSLIDLFMGPLYGIIEADLKAGAADIDDAVLNNALAGQSGYQRRYSQEEGEMMIVGHPIIVQDQIIGSVLLKQNTNRILELRRDALQRIVGFSVISLVIFGVFIFRFSLILTRRIKKLGAEATGAIDIYGRLKTNQIRAETRSGDEIGDLARSISGMLARLHQYNQFLESMPRTLRHEINNPLNALSTSLQNLELETSEDARQKYLEAAQRGVVRIGMIVQTLADAASLKDALQAEELEVVNIYQLLQDYLHNCRSSHPGRNFLYRGTTKAVLIKASDYRIEQLLDKLIDNAVDFSEPGSTIRVSLFADPEKLTLLVSNPGTRIPSDRVETIFDSMVSIRAASSDSRLHFGMGLYVVRIITEHHGGSVTAANTADGQGVTVTVTLPVHQEQPALAQAAG